MGKPKRRGDGLWLRGKTWMLDIRHQGQRYVMKIGHNINRSTAQEIAAIKRAEIFKGEVGLTNKPEPLTFDEAAKLHLQRVRTDCKPRTITGAEKGIKKLTEEFGGWPLERITEIDLQRYKAKRLEQGKKNPKAKKDGKVTCNHELARLNAIFNDAPGSKNRDNPVEDVKSFRVETTKGRILTPEEEVRLLGACHDRLRPMVAFALDTGFRLCEVMSLSWPDVNMDGGKVTVQMEHSKTHRPKTVNMTKRVRAILESILAEGTTEGAVFRSQTGDRYKSIYTAWNTAREAAGLKDFRFHDNRHTNATRHIEEGTDLATLRENLGWSTVRIADRYLTPSDEAKRQSVANLSRSNEAARRQVESQHESQHSASEQKVVSLGKPRH